MFLLDTESLLTWTFISQCLSMQFKESLETQSINLGKTYFDGRLKVIYSWHQIASEHALEVTKTQYTILKSTHKVYEKPHIS